MSKVTTQKSKSRGFLIWFVADIALLVTWFTQPHFGWSFCLLNGIFHSKAFCHETDFVDKLREAILERERKWNRDPSRLEKINATFDLMNKCVAKRGIYYCRYAGPPTGGTMVQQQDPDPLPRNEPHKFEYIDENSKVSINMTPWGNSDSLGGNLLIVYNGERLLSQRMCTLDCNCNAAWH